MKRVQEKVKDLVDVRTYETVKNYATDMAATVAAYRFTDVTSDLMAKWLDEIVELMHRNGGTARALAGNRGVGKSHFLSVLGALTAHPELRNRITDQHVSLSAQRLPRQNHFVVNVERGLGATLAEEVQAALDKAFNASGISWGDTPAQMITNAAGKTGELPLIVVVDSGYERKARVKRDDGALLGEMAEAARNTRTFLAIALDDDIAGADGVNAAIARTCLIEYLDQEHLYRIVDAFLYQKRASARPILRELYQGFREAAPGFNWSEPRFASLYPIHPVVVDVTPSVRLYAPKFAFLPFVSESASKVMTRPAHSLLALDEVFDRVESDLRKSAELEETFAVYDELAEKAVAQVPLMQRLQAKLILKGLFLLSLDGRGATAKELGAAMLFYDEHDPLIAVQKIEDMITLFASIVPEDKLRRTPEDNETRYSLGNSVNASFEAKLAEAAQKVTPNEIGQILRRIGHARFSDWVFTDFGFHPAETSAAEVQIHWRGSTRRGRISWQWGEDFIVHDPTSGEHLDWQMFITAPNSPNASDQTDEETPRIYWQPAELRRDEEEAVRRFAALLTTPELVTEFEDTAIAAEQTAASVVERIWTRIFLEDGVLSLERVSQPFSSEAKSARTLTETLDTALAPIFNARFFEHPQFEQHLTASDVSQLVSDLFGGANVNSPETQKLAEMYAVPLGLVARRGSHFILETDENLLKLPLIQRVLETTGAANGKGVSLRDLQKQLKAAPHGLQREAQNLLLAALVARRRLEFVTTTNDRITHRSLDLKIIWADIVGVAQSSVQPRTSAELAQWASLLTGVDGLMGIDEPAEIDFINAILRKWFDNWQTKRVLVRFDELTDEVLNVRAWRTSSHVARSFGVAAESVQEHLRGEVSLEESLERVIDAFGETPENMNDSRQQLAELECFLDAAHLRQAAWRYIARAEATDDEQIETLRHDILDELAIPENAFDVHASQMFERMWHEFRHLYTEFYVRRHNAVMHSTARMEMLEQIEGSEEWSEFLGLSNLPISHPNFIERATGLRSAIKAAKCSYDVRQMLQTHPFCACGLRLIQVENLEQMPRELVQTVSQGRATMRRMLAALSAPLSTALSEISATEKNKEFAARAVNFAEKLQRGEELPMLSPLDLRLLAQAAQQMPIPTVRVRTPRGIGAVSREEMRSKLNLWLDNLPNAPVLVKFQEDEQ